MMRALSSLTAATANAVVCSEPVHPFSFYHFVPILFSSILLQAGPPSISMAATANALQSREHREATQQHLRTLLVHPSPPPPLSHVVSCLMEYPAKPGQNVRHSLAAAARKAVRPLPQTAIITSGPTHWTVSLMAITASGQFTDLFAHLSPSTSSSILCLHWLIASISLIRGFHSGLHN